VVHPPKPPEPAVAAPAPAPPEPRKPAPKPDLRAVLREGIRGLLRASPDQRPAAVTEFARLVDRLALDLTPLAPSNRRVKLQPLQALLNQWQRMMRGLAPGVRQELEPASQLLEKSFRLR